MTQLSSEEPKAPLSEDELAESITRIVNTAASLPDGMDVSKHLASTYAVYLDRDREIAIPKEVVDLELLRVIGALEARIVALEASLDKAGIEHPKVIKNGL